MEKRVKGDIKLAITPMMQQYLDIKEKCKDCILFFRLGDFYEMFFEDAEIASRELELVLTGKDCGLENRAPMCGIPFHAADSYLGRLINKGYKVAICEQMEDPALAKGIVKRGIIKVVTPGTYMDSNYLENNKNNYIVSLYNDTESNTAGLCFSDISTGEFICTDIRLDIALITDELSKFSPKEIIFSNNLDDAYLSSIKDKFNISCTQLEEEYFTKKAYENIAGQFNDFDSQKYDVNLIYACNGLLNYIFETQKLALSNLNNIEYYNVDDYVNIDINSRKNLELTENIREKGKKGSLLWVVDKTNTSMGARQLRKWVELPLINKTSIERRLDAVEELTSKISCHEDLKCALKEIYDIERIVGRISSQSVNCKELISLKNSIEKIPKIKSILESFNCALFKSYYSGIDELKDIYELINKSIAENPPITVKEGGIIKDGYNAAVDELRKAKSHGKEWIASLESTEREVTGVKSLKVGFNKVFGYYIEITNTNLSLVPEGRYIRKQTLSNAERFITPELKEMEDKILGAEEKLINLEYELFVEIRNSIEKHVERMKHTALIISEIDCISSFASIALENNYSKPKILKEGAITIKGGRHPVIEQMIPAGTFVSNDTKINNTDDQLLLITGPNMAGKSTYMRQVALIVIMAQIGSFVPAEEAKIAICDKIFTRIGASDDLAAGKSTFMVEMWEVANILNNATNKSLVLLDEVGRGTSTYDGLSIAWSVIEYICKNPEVKSKTLFATHYHELTKLEGLIPGVKNYSVAVKEIGNEIVFLRKIISGGSDQSYGIEVAKLAGIPEKVIKRAREILIDLEADKNISNEVAVTAAATPKKHASADIKQLGFFDIEKDALIKELADVDINSMTPIQSLNTLYELVKNAKAIKNS